MKCDICDTKYTNYTASFLFRSKAIGDIIVPSVKRLKCFGCGKELIDSTESKAILEYVKRKEQEAINSLPVGEFLSLNEAASILGISKQAFNKNARIKRGFIYSAIIDNKKLYYRKSVEEFKRTGKDGRISLYSTQYQKAKHVNKGNSISNWLINKSIIKKQLIHFPKESTVTNNVIYINHKRKEERNYSMCN